MKKCTESAKKCPWAGTGYCGYYSGLIDSDPCPQQLHSWNELNDEFTEESNHDN